MAHIAFGTSGWRGILCEDFTFENVKIVTQAIADYLKDSGEAGNGVIVGCDTRFMGKRFTEEAAAVLAGAGIKALLCSRDVPTPVIAFEILRRGAAGGINFTASHNPPEYNGIKFSPSWGGPALPETTKQIERRANEMMGDFCYSELSLEEAKRRGLLEVIDPHSAYLSALEQKVDFDALKTIGKLGLNPLYGTARGYLDAPLKSLGIPYAIINDHLDPYFGGQPPEPSEAHIPDFIALVKNDPTIRLGLATDGDADRFGILDADGTYIEPNYIIALLLDYLIRVRKLSGGVARSVATSHFVDAVAKKHGVPVYETPVGFKYIGELIAQDKIVIGGEESAGLTIKGHVPEKDGILACFLVAEMVAREGKTVRELLERMYAEVGRFVTRRDNLKLSPELEAAYPAKVAAVPKEIAGSAVAEVSTLDGVKLILSDGSWMLFRKSGTEPVVRLYGEASSEARLAEVMAAGKAFILN
ncbi:phosphoglucomutase/phosphomannomutase family protein [Trichlorobacter lovleyi]|uniref:phosphoglucomutase/phosphomannomutase family protein n=1 Tax=Trichlorobacter lovleyi TaxID=313985 RepID=UPI0022400906|nr:phosphoglucomutase/phosphomannomutase family protein [Trichlorobacter lovleyi]QOX78618.1 phosphoglucomutase/phosphomannomutase family protein [Trichlorobacter lovleyi]